MSSISRQRVPMALGVATLAATVLALPLAPTACAAQDAPTDTIVYVDGGARKTRAGVVIDSATYDEVKFKAGGRSSTMSGTQILEIQWGDAPREYGPAWRSLNARDGEAARRNFDACLGALAAGVVERDWVKEYANIGLGEAYLMLAAQDSANLSKASAAFELGLKANAKSLLLDRALKGLAEAALAAKKGPDALKHADRLLGEGKKARRPSWELDAYFLRAKVHTAGGNASGASQAYADAERLAAQQAGSAKNPADRTRFESIRRTAAAAGGWVLLDTALASKSSADFDKARLFFQGLPAKFGKVPEILSAVENAMGVIKLSGGDAHAALEHFQKSEVLYFSVSSEVARSLYYQAQAWDQLGDTEQKGARIRDLKQYYPKSEWARKVN